MTETVRHEVRKDAKQLRYAIGFLDGAWPKAHRREQRSRFTRQLTRLQDSLGALNDLAVASASRDTMFATCDPITAARLGARLESLLSSQSESQARLLRSHTIQHISFGPSPTGWKRSSDIACRCLICGYLLRSMTTDYETCLCGEMSVDIAAGRFGSWLGDQSIEVVRLLPRDE